MAMATMLAVIESTGNCTPIPAIALTAMAGRENWVRALKAGFNTHVVKPVDPEELVMLIYNLVGGRSDDV
jgi:CheY-like chemotaxis protein